MRLFLSIAIFSFVIYLIPGMFGAPLKALSGFLPPQTTQDFNIGVGSVRPTSSEASGICEIPKFDDMLHLPHGLTGYFDLDQALTCASEQDKPVFVDFTGHGCVNCREMEAKVWSDPLVLKRLSEDFIVLALYVDDRTKLPEGEWYKSNYDGKMKKTIGQQNADYQITKFNNNAQPYYAVLTGEGDPIGLPKAYDLNIAKFVAFLDEAKAKFKSSKNN